MSENIKKKLRAKPVVKPFWHPPSLIIRQALSAIYIGILTRWRKLPNWFLNFGFKCLPGAAGSIGMGCIGFPAHPVLEITSNCNLNCIHCHTSGSIPVENELATHEIKLLLDQLAEIEEFRMVAFTGGEPLIRKDFYKLLAYSKSLGFSNTIATNATLINEDIAHRLSRLGVAIAAVSLDGFDAKTHDMVRGLPGSFNAAIKGIQALKKAGILLHINITAMEYNLNQVKKLTNLVDELGAGILLMYQLVPVGRGKQISKAALDLNANEKLIKFMAQAQRNTNAIMEPVAGPQYWPFLLKQAGITGGPLLRLAELVFHGCSAGRGFVYVKPDGEVWPCPFIEVSCGNIHRTPFKTIWNNSPILKKLRAREKLIKGRCGECQYRKLCGGCRGRSWSTTGDYLAEDPSCFIHNENKKID